MKQLDKLESKRKKLEMAIELIKINAEHLQSEADWLRRTNKIYIRKANCVVLATKFHNTIVLVEVAQHSCGELLKACKKEYNTAGKEQAKLTHALVDKELKRK